MLPHTTMRLTNSTRELQHYVLQEYLGVCELVILSDLGLYSIRIRAREFPDFFRVGKSGREMTISRDFPGSREINKIQILGKENAKYREIIVYLLLFEPFR